MVVVGLLTIGCVCSLLTFVVGIVIAFEVSSIWLLSALVLISVVGSFVIEDVSSLLSIVVVVGSFVGVLVIWGLVSVSGLLTVSLLTDPVVMTTSEIVSFVSFEVTLVFAAVVESLSTEAVLCS